MKDYKDGNKTQQGARLAKHDLVNSKNALRTNLNYQQEKVKPSGKRELRFVSLKQEGCLEWGGDKAKILEKQNKKRQGR